MKTKRNPHLWLYRVVASIFNRKNKPEWEYGSLRGQVARRHRKNGNVQIVIHYAGCAGHTEDYYHDTHKSWWNEFEP